MLDAAKGAVRSGHTGFAFAEYPIEEEGSGAEFVQLVEAQLAATSNRYFGCFNEARSWRGARRVLVRFRDDLSRADAEKLLCLGNPREWVTKIDFPITRLSTGRWVLQKQAEVVRGSSGNKERLFGEAFAVDAAPSLKMSVASGDDR